MPEYKNRFTEVAEGSAGCEGAKENLCALWWAHQDLNLEPTDYESAALTVELWAHRSTRAIVIQGLECVSQDLTQGSRRPLQESGWIAVFALGRKWTSAGLINRVAGPKALPSAAEARVFSGFLRRG
jgi:hypothetical protein